MKLVFYSGGDRDDNRFVDEALLGLISEKEPVFTFIPSSSYDSDEEFFDFIEHFQYYGVKRFLKLPVDIPVDDVLYQQALKSHLIFLGGGNTFYFLRTLKQSPLFRDLNQYLLKGGVMAGLSAGAIVMTPRIHTASFPEFDRDDNDENLKNWKAKGLVPFEFFPHYKNSKRYDKELLSYSETCPHAVYACADGAGIVVNSSSFTVVQKSFLFYRGKKILIRGIS